jgi:PAS domain S-box-containing protein
MVERWFAGGAIGGVAVWCPGPGVTRDGVGRADSRAHVMLSTSRRRFGAGRDVDPLRLTWTFAASAGRPLSAPRRSTDTSRVSDDGQQRSDDVEQVLLGLADGSYVLSTPEGVVAECGAGAVALLGASAEHVLLADRTRPGSRVVRGLTPVAAQRSLRLVVVAVPLALGWEFTSLLGELGSRDAGTWDAEALRVRHGRALDAIERVCDGGDQPAPGARLAGILVVVRDVDAPPLTREDVDRRMAEHRAAARAAAAAAAEPAGLEDLVARARILRERVEDAEREREDALAQLAAASVELDAEAGQREARDEAHARAQAAEADAEGARAQAAAARTDAERAREELSAVRGDLERTREEPSAVRGDLERTRAVLEATRAELAAARAAADAIRAEFAFEHVEPSAEPASAPCPALPPAEPGHAIALIGLDGSFTRLDDAFCSLLGCREEDLRSARWPSIIDRQNLAAHHELGRALRAGEIDSAVVETVYMHAQGLLVPIAGTVSMHRDDGGGDGAPTHFLFRADVSRTLGPRT